MSNTFIPVNVTAKTPVRGGGTQPTATFAAQSMSASFAWGSSPGTATIVYVGDNAPIATGAWVELSIGAHLFVGICKSDVRNLGSGEGLTRTLQFVDLREYLTWDYTFSCFNKPHVVLVNGVRQKRYKHIYPNDFNQLIWTFTNAPLLAYEILAAIFAGPNIGTTWTYDLTGGGDFPGGLMNFPIYDFDCLNGKRLDAALNEICDRSGCVFGLFSTLSVPYKLVFTRKGYGSLPAPPANSDNRRAGLALSGHPTNVRILGERNLYQVMGVPMQPDWSRAWERFLVFELFADYIYHLLGYDSIPDDTEAYVGRQRATARALSITVREFAVLAGAQYGDSRKFAGRWRMDMPAALYISTLLFRAFRPADGFTFVNAAWSGSEWVADSTIPLTSLDIADRLLCRVYQDDPTDGTMQFNPSLPTDGNGFAIAQGYMVGADLFKNVRSDQFNLDFFRTANIWQHIPFQIDDSGEGVRFIIFDEPVILSENLVFNIDGHSVINAQAGLSVPAVRAALVFEAERFSRWNGVAGKESVENVGGLNLEAVVDGSNYTEIPYANGETAISKADAIGQSLLLRQFYYAEGGYKLIWVPGTPVGNFGVGLNSMIDRVQIVTSPREGTYEVVDYANERQREVFEPERELDRRTQTNSLFPGQNELRIQAEYARKLAAAFKQLPGIRRSLGDLLSGAIGSDESLGVTWFAGDTSGLGLIPAGTVIRKSPSTVNPNTKTIATNPSEIGPEDSVFVGVTVRDGEDPGRQFKVQSTGTAVVRVMGPVKANDILGLASAADGWEYLVVNGTPAVGRALQEIQVSEVRLIHVALGGGGGGQAGKYRIKDVFDDYLVCRKWDGTADGEDDVYVAKEWKHRTSLESETILGALHEYTYADGPTEEWESGGSAGYYNLTRNDNETWNERIVPPWTENEVIHAMPATTDVKTEDDEDVKLLILGRSCQWAIKGD